VPWAIAAYVLGVSLVRRSICQTLPDDALHGFFHAHLVGDAKGLTFIIPVVELGKISFQVLLADVVVHAVDAALEDRKIPFNRVGVSIAAHVLANAVID
jgi:hypothetical protein